jgi:hypothetical protein
MQRKQKDKDAERSRPSTIAENLSSGHSADCITACVWI